MNLRQESNYQPISLDTSFERDRNRETEDALEWLYLGGITALQKNEAVCPLFLLLLLINDGIGRVSLGMREKGGVTGQGVKLEELVTNDIVLCNVSRQPVE